MHHNDASNDSVVAKTGNESYEKDLKNALKYTRWVLEFLGVWPLVTKNPSKTRRYFSTVLIVACNGALALTLVPTAIHMIVREKCLMSKVMLMAPIGSCFTEILKYGLIVFKSKTIKLCIEHMETDWRIIESPVERAIMTKIAKIGRGLTLAFSAILYSGGLSYHLIMPVLKGTRINEFNKTVRPTVYPGFDIFFDAQRSPTYEIIFCGILVSGFVRYNIAVAFCSLTASFVTHACGQIQIAISRLENLFDGVDDARDSCKIQERLAVIINCHVKGLSLSSDIEATLRYICLIDMVTSALVICLLEYYCMREWNNSETLALVTYFTLLISRSFNIFILCQISELLQEQYHKIGTAIYMIDWYKLSGKSGRTLVMVISMASYPQKLTAGGMMDLSVASFGAIIKTSIAYLNMLRTFAVE